MKKKLYSDDLAFMDAFGILVTAALLAATFGESWGIVALGALFCFILKKSGLLAIRDPQPTS